VPLASLPFLDTGINLTPPSEIEIANAEICPVSDFQDPTESRKEL
jgi:hypothetical protein